MNKKYIRTKWQDRVINIDTLEIVKEGTPRSAKNLNNIEEGIENLYDIVDNTIEEINKNIDSHIKNNDIHVTKQEKDLWNKSTVESQPNFKEKNESKASFGEDLQVGKPNLGNGWSEDKDGSYVFKKGSTGVLSFPVKLKYDNIYKLEKSGYKFSAVLSNNLEGKDGQKIGKLDKEVFFKSNNNYDYLNILPENISSDKESFKLNYLKELISLNSESLKIKDSSIIKNNNNIFIGDGGKFNLGNYNTSLGINAMYSNIKGSSNTAVGSNAMELNTTGYGNTAIGSDAMKSNTIGIGNVAVGDHAMKLNTTGCGNVAIGRTAMESNTTGDNNIAMGRTAMKSNTTGYGNIALGDHTMHENTIGYENTAVGKGAMYENTTGYGNTAVGKGAMKSNTTGSKLTAVGYEAAEKTATGENLKNGENSVFIGANSKGNVTENQENQIVIGAEAVSYGPNTVTLGNREIEKVMCQAGGITQLSDKRIKEEIEKADLNKCYEAVKKLQVTRYKYKDFTGKHRDKHVTGFLAEDVEKVFPKAVSKSNMCFTVLDEKGNKVYEKKLVKEKIEEKYEEIEKIEKEIIDAETKEKIIIIEKVPVEKTRIIEKEVEKEVEKTFLIEDIKDITMTEAVPTLWGAVQKLMEKLEEQEKIIQNLKK